MSNLVQSSAVAIEAALIHGDTSKLSIEQKLNHYKNVCETLGLNPLTKPFEYMRLNGKEVMYATKGCAEQLRAVHKISLKVVDKQKVDDVYIVTSEATDKEGRTDSATGAVSIVGFKGEALANAFMKAETKAKRRVTLSICGLNMLDELEVETIADAQKPLSVSEKPLLSQEVADHQPGEYKPTFGKFKGKILKEVDMFELDNYVTYLKDGIEKSGNPAKPFVAEFLTAAENYLISLEPPTEVGA